MRIFLLLLLLPLFGEGQTMQSIVRLLPGECLSDLNNKEKDSLFKETSFVLPDGDSLSTIEYDLDTVLKNYVRIESSYTTGQSGFGIFELKRFKMTNGSNLVIFSECGGSNMGCYQDTLMVFFLKDGKLIEDKRQKYLPESISIYKFIKKQTPDSIKDEIYTYGSNFYNLSNIYTLNTEKPNEIEFVLSISPEISPEESDYLNKWLLGNTFIFTWDGKSFKRKLVFEKP